MCRDVFQTRISRHAGPETADPRDTDFSDTSRALRAAAETRRNDEKLSLVSASGEKIKFPWTRTRGRLAWKPPSSYPTGCTHLNRSVSHTWRPRTVGVSPGTPRSEATNPDNATDDDVPVSRRKGRPRESRTRSSHGHANTRSLRVISDDAQGGERHSAQESSRARSLGERPTSLVRARPRDARASSFVIVKRPSARRGPGIVSVDRNVRSKCRCSCVLQFTS